MEALNRLPDKSDNCHARKTRYEACLSISPMYITATATHIEREWERTRHSHFISRSVCVCVQYRKRLSTNSLCVYAHIGEKPCETLQAIWPLFTSFTPHFPFISQFKKHWWICNKILPRARARCNFLRQWPKRAYRRHTHTSTPQRPIIFPLTPLWLCDVTICFAYLINFKVNNFLARAVSTWR